MYITAVFEIDTLYNTKLYFPRNKIHNLLYCYNYLKIRY